MKLTRKLLTISTVVAISVSSLSYSSLNKYGTTPITPFKNLLTLALLCTARSFTSPSLCSPSTSPSFNIGNQLAENSYVDVSYISSSTAKSIDETLMSIPGFSIDQLMELAGYSVACAVNDYYKNYLFQKTNFKILIVCGPGNNGGDGLVAARHLKHFGYEPTIVLPKQSTGQLFVNLVKQCKDLDISILNEFPESSENLNYSIIVDALFGFSFTGPARPPFSNIINHFRNTRSVVISVDVPSGWHVDNGDDFKTGFTPNAVISLTAPKNCMKNFNGVHYVGGRFIPPSIATTYQISLPMYGLGSNQIALITNIESKKAKVNDVGLSLMYVTAPNKIEAEKISKALIEKKLAACVSVFTSPVESFYEWEGKLEKSSEILLMIKTTDSNIDEVTNTVKTLHSYTIPESIAISIVGGNADYINWVKSTTHK